MKLKNQLITRKLRQFYFENNWHHKEVQLYLEDHFNLQVSLRTLKYWKKKLEIKTWNHPAFPIPPVPVKVAKRKDIFRLINLRKRTGWEGHIFMQKFMRYLCP